jgi:hypothetical protein
VAPLGVLGGAILDGGTEHAASHTTATERKARCKSDESFKEY